MERNAVLAVVVSIAILLLYQEFVIKRFYPPPSQDEIQTSEPQAPPAAANAPSEVNPAPPSDSGSANEAATAEVHAAANNQLVTVDTPLYTATFGTSGARLVSFKLKRYRTTVDADSPPQEAIVPGQAGELPIGVELRGAQGVQILSDTGAGYSVNKNGLTLQGNESGDLDFQWSEAGLTLDKRFSFHADSYAIDGQVEVIRAPAGYNELLLSWSKLADGVQSALSEMVFDHAVLLNGKKLVQHQFKDMQKGEVVEGDIRWIGYAGRHFFGGLSAPDAHNTRAWLKTRDRTADQKLLIPITPEGAKIPLSLYLGPKDVDVLDKAGHDFARAVDLGWFGFIALPMLHVLELSHRFTGNYGVDIILLTLVIKILFIPLTQTSYKSMQ
ncbi:MAG: membrane protein insertase YidC, partial [Deltaproteobacteria bacterium]|nr:membrane protein insertase YidC [Deltaproteobacteria bacterium]